MSGTIQELYAECCGGTKIPALIEEKARWMLRLLPAARVADIGGMWLCNGFYSYLAATRGAEHVTLVDAQSTERFHQINQRVRNVEWVNADFYHGLKDGSLAATLHGPLDALIVYDVVLHQPEPIHFLAGILEATGARRAVIANPVLARSARRNDLVFAPYSEAFKRQTGFEYSRGLGDRAGWTWVFSHGFLLNLMKYLKLRVVEEKLLPHWDRKAGLAYSLLLVERD